MCLPSDIATQLSTLGAPTLRLSLPGASGAAVYVNGQLAYTATSAGPVQQYWTHTASLTPSALFAGANTVAVRVDGLKGAKATGFDLDVVYSAGAPMAAGPLSCD
jgi:hypothetical protein